MNDQQRCERLYRAHADEVHAYARRRSDRQTADEVVAEVFLVAWRRLDDVPSPALPWLLGVARRVLANQRRSASRTAALRSRIEASTFGPEEGGDPGGQVLAALALLAPRDREILLLLAWEGLRPEEVATVLGISRAAVATRVYRARRRLEDALADEVDPTVGRKEELR